MGVGGRGEGCNGGFSVQYSTHGGDPYFTPVVRAAGYKKFGTVDWIVDQG